MYNKLPAIKTQIDTNKDIVEKSANISIKQ
jgi:hypothetical protein